VIAPQPESNPEPADLSQLVELTESFFRPGGRMEQACRGTDFDYEVRPQQRAMARAVAEALAAGRHLAVEAGTGVGKSFAYLVPMILAATLRKQPAVVSTYTISLQEQLMHKDLPFLREHLGVPFKPVLVKGRSNYLCLRRLARAERNAPELFKSRQEEDLERLRAWSEKTAEGSVQELKDQPLPDVWNAVNVEHGNCMWHRCPEYNRCFLMKARAAIREADLLVVNHHLFFSDLSLRTRGGAILPESGLAVLDEAHQVENVASEHLGLRLSQSMFEYWLRRLYVPDTGKGLLGVLKKSEAAHSVTQLYEGLERFFHDVRTWAGFKKDKTQQVVSAPPPWETNLPALITQLTHQLRQVHEELEDLDLRAEVQAARRRGHEMREALEAFLRQSIPDCVYWVSSEGARRTLTVLYAAPIEVGPLLTEHLFSHLGSVVMTSATLAVGDDLDYFLQRMGAPEANAVQVGSPFDYGRQMKIILPAGLPDPNQFEPFAEATAQAVNKYVRLTKGRAFVLFTSDRLMRAVAAKVSEALVNEGYELIMQGELLSRQAMLERFRTGARKVLFGLDSFWMGVDVRGEALSNVIITKLPFAVPDEPVVKARMDRIAEQGGDPFRDYSLPEAILKLRQGVGRLIRSATDEGIVVILDPRMRTKWYGKKFLAALPECPVELTDE
jgi:ATP-dependent DNA helicase DinG